LKRRYKFWERRSLRKTLVTKTLRHPLLLLIIYYLPHRNPSGGTYTATLKNPQPRASSPRLYITPFIIIIFASPSTQSHNCPPSSSPNIHTTHPYPSSSPSMSSPLRSHDILPFYLLHAHASPSILIIIITAPSN